MNSQGVGDYGDHELRARCERCRGLLGELARIHLAIDAPTRRMQADEPDWIGRLRKICLHVRAIDGWEIGAGVEHVMATELRAAYVQMDAVWKHLPAMFRLGEMDGGWWAEEASNGMLATYDHLTPQSLMLPVGRGGFRNGEDEMSYAQRAVWLGRLGLGYGACARLPIADAGRRRGHHVSCDGGAALVCRGTVLTARMVVAE